MSEVKSAFFVFIGCGNTKLLKKEIMEERGQRKILDRNKIFIM
jgi:hypothetical protein